ncbi:MAG: acyltransferase family protein, partial [Promethearchaeota archaeon]
MKRVKSIDMIRGFCIFLMVLGHLLDWWIINSDRWLVHYIYSFLASIAATGFLFVSGFSTTIAFKSRAKKVEISPNTGMTHARNIYIIRALLLLSISLIYNTAIALTLNDLRWIWAWNVLQTISISLLLAWPLLRTPKYLRIGLGIGLLVVNELFSPFLLAYSGQLNIYGVLFHIFYHPIEATIFIIGTVVGDFFFKFTSIRESEERKQAIKRVFIRTILLIGILFTSFGIIYRFNDFINRRTLSATFYSLGVVLILLAILLYLEEFEKIKPKKRYRFFFYFSFYSFTVYLTHDPLYFIFYNQLNA